VDSAEHQARRHLDREVGRCLVDPEYARQVLVRYDVASVEALAEHFYATWWATARDHH
jgi:hypothetical protein